MSQSLSTATTIPPGAVTRAISATVSAAESTYSRTFLHQTRSNEASGNGSGGKALCTNSAASFASRARAPDRSTNSALISTPVTLPPGATRRASSKAGVTGSGADVEHAQPRLEIERAQETVPSRDGTRGSCRMHCGDRSRYRPSAACSKAQPWRYAIRRGGVPSSRRAISPRDPRSSAPTASATRWRICP